jgi:hypothetical protein
MAVGALLTLGLVSAVAPTSDPSASGVSFSVAYSAAADCPNQATFEAAILMRAPAARKAPDLEAARVRFEVELPHPGAGKPRLRALLDDGTSQDREITADGCAEAMQSMAVIAAMILDAQPREPESQPALPTPPAVTPPRASGLRATHPGQPGSARDASTSIRPSRRARGTWLIASAGAVTESAAAPDPAFGAALGGELGSKTPGGLAPSVRLTLIGAQAPTITTSVGDARFRLVLARAHGCALRFGSETSGVRLCAVVEAGALLGDGSNAINQRSQTMPWWGVGLAALGQLELSNPWSLEAGAGVRNLLRHDEFVFSPSTQVHQVPVFAWNFSVGLAYRVW